MGTLTKICSKCGEHKELELFPKHLECTYGRKGVCKACTYQQQKLRTKLDKDKNHKKYRKTLKGLLSMTYCNMLGRVLGRVKPHLYAGKEILSKEDFYEWSLTNPEYLNLHTQWVASGYDRKLSPSIDRIDPDGGYTFGNIRWVTHSENSSSARRVKKIVE